MLLSLCDVLLSVQFINRCELHRRLRKQVLRFSVLAFSVAADWYLRFSYLHFPPLQIHTYVCISCIFHPQESRNFILPISILAFSSTCTFSATPPKQSGVLSPVVFCLYMDVFLLAVRRTGVRCFIGRCFVGALAYAAVDLLAPSVHYTTICDEFVEKFDVSFNAYKQWRIYGAGGPCPRRLANRPSGMLHDN